MHSFTGMNGLGGRNSNPAKPGCQWGGADVPGRRRCASRKASSMWVGRARAWSMRASWCWGFYVIQVCVVCGGGVIWSVDWLVGWAGWLVAPRSPIPFQAVHPAIYPHPSPPIPTSPHAHTNKSITCASPSLNTAVSARSASYTPRKYARTAPWYGSTARRSPSLTAPSSSSPPPPSLLSEPGGLVVVERWWRRLCSAWNTAAASRRALLSTAAACVSAAAPSSSSCLILHVRERVCGNVCMYI